MLKVYSLISFIFTFCLFSFGQDTNQVSQSFIHRNQYRSIVIPVSTITYGFISLKSTALKNINESIQKNITPSDLNKKIHIDNYLQFTPGAIALGLQAAGIKGKHTCKEATIIYIISNLILNGIVIPTKRITQELRPDGSAYSSFPSGHTSEAFANAAFLSMEYRNRSPWYGVAGYTIAAATGYLRMYNNKHWFSDVIAGVGIGIASTKIAFWTYDKLIKKRERIKEPKL